MPSNDETSKRAWLSLMTGLTFFAIGLTGILMFFHVRVPGITLLHELGGLMFVVVAIWHVKLNWRSIVRYCSRPAGKLALAASTVVLGAFLGLGLGHDHHTDHGPCAPEATSPHP